jgi:hypothetical protein
MGAVMNTSDVDQLTRINSSIAAWEQTRDEQAFRQLDEIVSPNLVFRRADKTVVRKHEFIRGLRGPSPCVERESEDVAVEMHVRSPGRRLAAGVLVQR